MGKQFTPKLFISLCLSLHERLAMLSFDESAQIKRFSRLLARNIVAPILKIDFDYFTI